MVVVRDLVLHAKSHRRLPSWLDLVCLAGHSGIPYGPPITQTEHTVTHAYNTASRNKIKQQRNQRKSCVVCLKADCTPGFREMFRSSELALSPSLSLSLAEGCLRSVCVCED